MMRVPTHIPSWPGIAVRRTAFFHNAYARPSTPFLLTVSKDVDARDKRGHDGGE
jgi:hypothetical protein